MAPGIASSLTVALFAVFGGCGLWLQGQSRIMESSSQAPVGETVSTQGAPEEEPEIEFKLDLDVGKLGELGDFGELGKVEPIEQDLAQQPARRPPEHSLFSHGVALAFGLAGLFWSSLPSRSRLCLARLVRQHRQHHSEDGSRSEQQCGECHGQVPQVKEQVKQISVGEAATCAREGDKPASAELPGEPRDTDPVDEIEIGSIEEIASRESAPEFADEPPPQSEAPVVDSATDVATEATADFPALVLETTMLAGDDASTEQVRVHGDSRIMALAARAAIPFCTLDPAAETEEMEALPASDAAVLNSARCVGDFRSMSSVAWAEIHKPFCTFVGEPAVEGADPSTRGEVSVAESAASMALAAESGDEGLPQFGLQSVDLLNEGVVESADDVGGLFTEAMPAEGNDVTTKFLQLRAGFGPFASPSWVAFDRECVKLSAIYDELTLLAADPTSPHGLQSVGDFRSLSFAAWAGIHETFRTSVQDDALENAASLAQAHGDRCSVTFAPCSTMRLPAVVAAADVTIESPSHAPAMPDDALEAQSLSSEGVFDGKFLEHVDSVFDEEVVAARGG